MPDRRIGIIRPVLFALVLLVPFLIYPSSPSAATLLHMDRDEVLSSGSVYTITWTASPQEIVSKIEYSLHGFKRWKTIVDLYPTAELSYDWTVVVPADNLSKCFIRITTFDVHGKKVAVDVSNPFSIEVVRLLEPNGQYPIRSQSQKTIRWRTHQTLRPVASVRLSYSTNGGKMWYEIDTLSGNQEVYFWSVPKTVRNKKRAMVRVTLKDANGGVVGNDHSDATFEILTPKAPRKTIFYNAKIIPMEGDEVYDGAIYIKGNTIKAIGQNQEILARADKNTTLINLDGHTIIPGFIDPHTHLFNDAEWNGYPLNDVQWMALTNGVTGVGNIGDLPHQIEHYIDFANQGNMRIRSYHYLCYTDHCGNPCGDWYKDYLPQVEHAPNLWINGIKLFAERSVCPTIKPNFSDDLFNNLTPLGQSEWSDSVLFFSAPQMAEIIDIADTEGYQVAIHAIGDLGIQTTMDAIDMALNGSENIQRHMIFHNHFLDDNMVDQYAASGILAIVEPARPGQAEYYAGYVGKNNMKYFKRWKELIDLDVAVAGNSDWPYGSINPLRRLGQFVNSYVPVYPGRKDQALPVLEALKLQTIRAAYAMRNEDKTGSLNPGKLADIVVLSNNPLDTDPANMEDIKVMMTMVDGWVEYWNENLLSSHLSVKKFRK